MKLYVARDKNNNLYLYNNLPIRKEEGFYPSKCSTDDYLQLDNNLFPDIKWESEPQEVTLLKYES